MTSILFKDHNRGVKEKKNNLAAQSSLIGIAGALLLAGEAAAQTSNGVDVLTLDGVTSATLQDDGSLLVTLDSGEEYNIPPGSFETEGDIFLVPQDALDALIPVAPAAGSAGGANIGIIALGLAAAGGLAAVAASGGGDDAPAPPVPLPPNDAPVLTAETSVSVVENSTAVTTVSATDANAGDTVTFSLSGPDAALFNINSTTGEITFVGGPDFENPSDAGGDNVFDIVVNANDGSDTTSQDIQVTVTDVAEAPVITSAAAVSVAENQTAVQTATASDSDGDTVTFSLTGADASLFNIDAATGAITFIAPPDFEMPGDGDGDNIFDIVVNASDGTATTTQNLAVTVTDVNEAPAIASATAISVAENQTAVQTATASDVDGDTLTFSLTGTDAALFNIDAATGAITFAAPPDFEMPGDGDGDNVFDIIVNVNDGTATTTQNLAVTVTDVNEAPILMATTAVTVAENETVVQTAIASDVDGDMLTFSLTGTDAGLFNIDAATGDITFATPPDFEMPSDADGDNAFEFVVNVSDGTLSESQLVVVMVTDVEPEPMPIDMRTAPEEQISGVPLTITGTGGLSTGIIEGTLSGPDAAAFGFNNPVLFMNGITNNASTTTGVGSLDTVLAFINAPDFEMPGDADGDNIFEVTVTFNINTLGGGASDTVIQPFTFAITDDPSDNPTTPTAPSPATSSKTSLGDFGDFEDDVMMDDPMEVIQEEVFVPMDMFEIA